MPRRRTDLEVVVDSLDGAIHYRPTYGPDSLASDEGDGPSPALGSGGALRSSARQRATRKKSPYDRPPLKRAPLPPSSLTGLSTPMDAMLLAGERRFPPLRASVRIKGGKVTGFPAKQPPTRLEPLAPVAELPLMEPFAGPSLPPRRDRLPQTLPALPKPAVRRSARGAAEGNAVADPTATPGTACTTTSTATRQPKDAAADAEAAMLDADAAMADASPIATCAHHRPRPPSEARSSASRPSVSSRRSSAAGTRSDLAGGTSGAVETSEAERARAAAIVAKHEERERARVVRMLQEYEVTGGTGGFCPSPHTELFMDAEAAGNPHDAKAVRQRLRAAVQAAASQHAASAPTSARSDRGEGSSSSSAAPQKVIEPALSRAAFGTFLTSLSVQPGPRADDGYVADRLFAALDSTRSGVLTCDQLVRGLAPAFCRDRAVRRRWVWSMMYDQQRRGALSPAELWLLVSTMPEGCRLEDDLLTIVKAATAKADRARAPSTAAAAAAPREAGLDGTAARQLSVRQDEYVDGLDRAADPPTDEPDVLGLRRKKKPSLGARARSLALARRWLVPGLRTDAVPP